MSMYRIAILLAILAVCIAAAACSSAPIQTLDEQLEGKTGGERRAILMAACMKEADRPRWFHTPSTVSLRPDVKFFNDPLVTDMRALCKKMDALADPESEETSDPANLAMKCAGIVRRKQYSERIGLPEQSARTLHVCEEMLGRTIPLAK